MQFKKRLLSAWLKHKQSKYVYSNVAVTTSCILDFAIYHAECNAVCYLMTGLSVSMYRISPALIIRLPGWLSHWSLRFDLLNQATLLKVSF